MVVAMSSRTVGVCILLVNILYSSAENGLFYGEHYVTENLSVCAGAKFIADCGHNKVIVIQNATYGRMKLGECVKMDMGYLGCQANALNIVQRHCSGKRTCAMSVPNEEFMATRPCLELESYLQVQYTCVTVISAMDYPCSSQSILKVIPEKGLISSMRPHTNCDTTSTVWLIEAKAGQRVNATLIDFSFRSPTISDLTNQDPESCGTYVRDVTSHKIVPLCGGTKLNKHVMFSLGNALELVVEHHKEEEENSQFLLQYTMIGCPDPPIDSNSWAERTGNTISIGCTESQIVHKMTCVDTNWVGVYHNCSTEVNTDDPGDDNGLSLYTLPRGLMITAVLAIALVVGTTIVVIGIYLVKRERRDLPDERGAYAAHNIDTLQPPHRNSKHNTGNYWIDQPPPHSNGTIQHNHRHTPTLQRCYQYTETPTSSVTSDKRHEYTHIWDRPLPAPESQHSC